MNGLFLVRIIMEVIVVLLIGYGIIHEDRLIAFEDELFTVLKQWVKRGFKKGRGSKSADNVQR